MSSVTLFIQLAGAVTLLLWAVRQVRTGVERAYGSELKNLIRRASSGNFSLVSVGALTALALQSSTAVAILVSGFFASGFIAGAAGLVLMLGADIGSALAAQILSFNLSWLTPLFLTIGGVLFLKGDERRIKQAGRILMGIGLVLVSLKMMSEATIPLRESEALPAIADFLSTEYVIVFLLGAAFTWLIHSSVAAILLFAAFAAQGILPLQAGLTLMLGANLGGGLIAVALTRGAQPEMRRLPLGNLIFRGFGATLALIVLYFVPIPSNIFGLATEQIIVGAHVAFNVALTLICLPFAAAVSRFAEQVLPSTLSETEEHPLARRESALDRAAISTPRRALASASRELLHIGEIVEVMFAPAMDLFQNYDAQNVESLRRLDDLIDRAHSDVKLYLAELNRGVLSSEESRRSMELTSHAINLEHIGDLISKDLFTLAAKRHEKSVTFSKDGWSELTRMHDRVLANMRLAMNILVSSDIDSARELMEEKEQMRALERASHEAHLQRLQSGAQQSIDTSDIHLETVRALKQINSLFALVAYPILKDSGELLESRLARTAGT